MYLSMVVGTVVSTQKDASLVGYKLLLTRRLDEAGAVTGIPEVAVDTVGAGVGERVIITRGSSARYASGKRDTAVDATIVGIVDAVEVSEA